MIRYNFLKLMILLLLLLLLSPLSIETGSISLNEALIKWSIVYHTASCSSRFAMYRQNLDYRQMHSVVLVLLHCPWNCERSGCSWFGFDILNSSTAKMNAYLTNTQHFIESIKKLRLFQYFRLKHTARTVFVIGKSNCLHLQTHNKRFMVMIKTKLIF